MRYNGNTEGCNWHHMEYAGILSGCPYNSSHLHFLFPLPGTLFPSDHTALSSIRSQLKGLWEAFAHDP